MAKFTAKDTIVAAIEEKYNMIPKVCSMSVRIENFLETKREICSKPQKKKAIYIFDRGLARKVVKRRLKFIANFLEENEIKKIDGIFIFGFCTFCQLPCDFFLSDCPKCKKNIHLDI